MIKRFNHDYELNDQFDVRPSVQSTSNFSPPMADNACTPGNAIMAPSTITQNIQSHFHTTAENFEENLKNLGKPSYNTNDNNLIASKRNGPKNVEKRKLFAFNKRRPIYEQEDFDMLETSNLSTVFFEINESNIGNNTSASRFAEPQSANSNKENDNCINENQVNSNFSNAPAVGRFSADGSPDNGSMSSDQLKSCYMKAGSIDDCLDDGSLGITENRNSLLKRKGICSSQEMLHLVDIMNEHISAEQVDVLAKSLVELGATSESLKNDFEDNIPDNETLLESFPSVIDEKVLETIDAAIYENQIIFEERIRKNQLTIQNLKLQDQLLSKYIDDLKLGPFNETLSIRDYENMCFANIARQNRGIKHWRNYLQDINTHQHDSSTVQHSSFYVNTNTMSNSLTDLYINENDLTYMGDKIDERGASEAMDSITSPVSTVGDDSMLLSGSYKKRSQWQIVKVPAASNISNCSYDGNVSDDLYIRMNEGSIGSMSLPEKNILVETINKISIVDSPIKSLKNPENHQTSLGNKN